MPASLMIASIALWGSAPAQPDQLQWSLDTEKVMVGGCVTLTLECPSHRLPLDLGLALQGREPIALKWIGPQLARGQKTLFLLWWKVIPPGPAREGTDIGRFNPMFDQPGEVPIELVANGQSLGTRKVTVVEAIPDARDASSLLYPAIPTSRPVDLRPLLWHMAIIHIDRASAIPNPENDFVGLRSALPRVEKHPDWRDIARAVCDHSELQSHTAAAIQQWRAAGKSRVPVSPAPDLLAVAERIAVAREKAVFAQAIRDIDRRTIEQLKAGAYGPKLAWPASQPTSEPFGP